MNTEKHEKYNINTRWHKTITNKYKNTKQHNRYKKIQDRYKEYIRYREYKNAERTKSAENAEHTKTRNAILTKQNWFKIYLKI